MNMLAKTRIWWHRWLNPPHTRRIRQLLRKARHRTQAMTSQATTNRGVEVIRDRNGDIRRIRIGAWRTISTSGLRRIVDIKENGKESDEGQRISVCIELANPLSMSPTTTIWEHYDRQGHLLSMLQSTDDSSLWLETRYQTNRQVKPQCAKSHRTTNGENSKTFPAWA